MDEKSESPWPTIAVDVPELHERLRELMTENELMEKQCREAKEALLASRRRVWERLHALEVQSDHVRYYLDSRRAQHALDPARQDPYPQLAPEVLVGLVEILVAVEMRLRRMVDRYMQEHLDPPLLVIDRGDIQLRAGELNRAGQSAQIIVQDEWPGVERGIVSTSSNIYFRDFLRSLWRRLTKRLHT